MKPDSSPPRNQHAEHTALVKSLLVAISEKYMPRCMVWNLNVLVGGAERNFTRSAPNGSADIVGAIDPGDGVGRAVAVECKTGTGDLSERQRAFRGAWLAAGGVYIVARDVERTMELLDAALRGRERAAAARYSHSPVDPDAAEI
jgi:hypothetical protein